MIQLIRHHKYHTFYLLTAHSIWLTSESAKSDSSSSNVSTNLQTLQLSSYIWTICLTCWSIHYGYWKNLIFSLQLALSISLSQSTAFKYNGMLLGNSFSLKSDERINRLTNCFSIFFCVDNTMLFLGPNFSIKRFLS